MRQTIINPHLKNNITKYINKNSPKTLFNNIIDIKWTLSRRF